VELIVGTLFVLGMLAIAIRFAPRAPSGEVLLPRVIENSIGMWALRRLTGRRLAEPPQDAAAADPGLFVEDVERRLAGGGAGPSAAVQPVPSLPTRAVVSGGPVSRLPGVDEVTARRVALLTVTGQRARAESMLRAAEGRGSRRFTLPLVQPPRFATMAAVLAIAVVGLLLALQVPPPSPGGQVLSALGTPERTELTGTGSAGAAANGPTGSTEPIATGSPGTIVVTPRPVATPTHSPHPVATPERTFSPAPTPSPTPVVTAKPTAKPTLKPTPAPTPTTAATPTPTPVPTPRASISCVLVVLEITCDGSASDRAVSYTFTFGDGDVAGGTSPAASHTYLDLGAASNPVTLVVQDGLGQTDSAVWTPP
jgi:PKD domain-containing protein